MGGHFTSPQLPSTRRFWQRAAYSAFLRASTARVTATEAQVRQPQSADLWMSRVW